MIKEYFLKLNKVLVGITTIALISIGCPYLIAADDDADVEEIVVTGSRIKRDTINSASVVTTITSEDIEQSQALLTADILRLSTYNTFGSFGPTAGSSAMSNATVSMRGLGGGSTLVLWTAEECQVHHIWVAQVLLMSI